MIRLPRKRMFWILLAVTPPLLVLLVGGLLSLASRRTPELGLHDNKLRPCPASPNCVCSETNSTDDATQQIEPFTVAPEETAPLARLANVIEQQGGTIESQTDTYLHATFRTRLFRYVDDVECRLDEAAGLIHIRSASRVGRSDLGANRKRVEVLRDSFNKR